jgi:4-hydroxyphenylpyruvate dioxygenase
VFQSPLYPGNNEIGDFVTRHGDTVKDIAFSVEDVDKIYNTAVSRGVKSIKEP